MLENKIEPASPHMIKPAHGTIKSRFCRPPRLCPRRHRHHLDLGTQQRTPSGPRTITALTRRAQLTHARKNSATCPIDHTLSSTSDPRPHLLDAPPPDAPPSAIPSSRGPPPRRPAPERHPRSPVPPLPRFLRPTPSPGSHRRRLLPPPAGSRHGLKPRRLFPSSAADLHGVRPFPSTPSHGTLPLSAGRVSLLLVCSAATRPLQLATSPAVASSSFSTHPRPRPERRRPLHQPLPPFHSIPSRR